MADAGPLSKSSEKFPSKKWLRAWTLELQGFDSTFAGFVMLGDLLNLSVPGFLTSKMKTATVPTS